MNGKGSGRRPAAVDSETARANWARTFGSLDALERATWRASADKLNRDVARQFHGVDLDERNT